MRGTAFTPGCCFVQLDDGRFFVDQHAAPSSTLQVSFETAGVATSAGFFTRTSMPDFVTRRANWSGRKSKPKAYSAACHIAIVPVAFRCARITR